MTSTNVRSRGKHPGSDIKLANVPPGAIYSQNPLGWLYASLEIGWSGLQKTQTKKALSAPERQLAGLQVRRHVSALDERPQLLEVRRVTTLLCRISRFALTDSCAAKG